MSKHLQRDMENLHRHILSLSAMVEEMIDKAILALSDHRRELTAEVVDADTGVDQFEVQIEEECLKILALHQPVAADLRRIATVMKVNNDLERIADLAVNIAERAHAIYDYPEFPIPEQLGRMVTLTTQMVRGAMDAFVNLDAQSARRILRLDDEVDQHNREIIAELQDLMQRHPDIIPAALHCFSATRHVERIADHATNIAEDVVYLAEGEIVSPQNYEASLELMSKAKVLIVEDDRALADVLAYNLKQAGYEILVSHDGQDGLSQAQLKSPEIVILDLMLPVVDGHEVCRRLRADATTRDLMIVMLTAKAEESDELIGFSLGADDYVTKPFSVKVLLERIKALRRRRGLDLDSEDIIASHGIMVDRVRHRVTADGQPVSLTRSEFKLLDTLIRQPGRVFQRSELIDAALGEDTLVMERTIDVHIRALRKKLGEQQDVIETVRGVGYRFRDSAHMDEAAS